MNKHRSTNRFADNLKMIRKGKGLTQTQLADMVHLTKQSIINYEKGVNFPTGNRLNDLLIALDVTPEQLLGKESIQLEEEKVMLELCQKRAEILAGKVLAKEHGDSYDSVRKSLFANFNELNNDDLYSALCAYYDTCIEDARQEYISKLQYLMTTPSLKLSKDIVIAGNEEKD
ncbi:MAG: helix-turn-helix domain-containing protein [Coprobacillaceae bacterium]